ncbi:MAG: hypothetical protein K0R38_1049 [Polyangiaceae bacterium]|nr:hypothetical protein [Polyangiaceae bacterium]
MKPEIDSTQAPVYVVRWGPDLALQELDAHFEEVIALALSAPGCIGLVMDMSRSGRSATLLRARGSEGLKRAYANVGHKIAGVSHVIPEPLARSMMSIVYWLMPPPFPTEMALTVEAGVQWIRDRLALRQGRQLEAPQPRHV